MLAVDYISQFFKSNGVDTVFGYQGGNISYLIDSLVRNGIRFIENYNEQASSFAANSYAEVKGLFGVAISSSGPGAINMLNGVANAYYDGIPCLYITGDVNTLCRKKYSGVRQSDFQEVDIVSMASPITKKCYQVTSADEIPDVLADAMGVMFSDRKGPVLINLAHNLQRAVIQTDDKTIDIPKPVKNTICKQNVEEIITMQLAASHLPVILLGNGARDAISAVRKFIDRTHIPFVCTLKALNLYPESDCYFGFAGNYGADKAKEALNNADCILVLGARLDARVITAIENFKDKTIVHIDIDKSELGKHTSANYLRYNMLVDDIDFDKIQCLNKSELGSHIKTSDLSIYEELGFKSFFSHFSTSRKTIYTLDVGLHQMAGAKYLRLKNDDIILNSGGLGAMGFSLPAAIGAYYAAPDMSIVSISGDGGIQMNIQELETVRREKLPIKIFVMNNGCLGMIRNYQDLVFNKRHIATVEGFSSPDYQLLAKAFGFKFFVISKLEQIKETLSAIEKFDVPVLVEVKISTNDNID